MYNYVPIKDADFDSWQANLVENTTARVEDWGILADDFTTLKTAQTIWNDAMRWQASKMTGHALKCRAKMMRARCMKRSCVNFTWSGWPITAGFQTPIAKGWV